MFYLAEDCVGLSKIAQLYLAVSLSGYCLGNFPVLDPSVATYKFFAVTNLG